MISKGFYEQLETIASERHIEIEDVLTAVRTALIKACQLEGCKGAIEVEFNEEQKNVRIFENFIVVEEVDPEGPEGQITLDEAKELRARVRVGSEFRHEVKFSQIGRKGATRFKQIFIQGLKELGGKRAYEYFKEKEGEVVNATVIKKTDSVVGLSLGMDVVTFMPLEEILPGEKCEPGMQMKVCITKVEETGGANFIFVTKDNKIVTPKSNSISTKASSAKASMTQEEKEEAVKKATEMYNQKAPKPGSIAAKANMVKIYNENNNKTEKSNSDKK